VEGVEVQVEDHGIKNCSRGLAQECFVGDRIIVCCKLLDFAVVAENCEEFGVGVPFSVKFFDVIGQVCIADASIGGD